MRKIHSFLLATLCLLTASCSKDDNPLEKDDAGVYHITVAVSGNSAKGNVHIYNLDGVRFKNEQTGTSCTSVDESFSEQVEYSTEGQVSQITVQGILYSKESATITMQVKKDGKSVFHQTKQIEDFSENDTTVDLVYSTVK